MSFNYIMKKILLSILLISMHIVYAQEPYNILRQAYNDKAPGTSLAIRTEGKTTYHQRGLANLQKAYPIAITTHFRMASVSKQFTAMAIYLLHRQGKLNLEDPISKYLEGLPPRTQAITISHLLNHTSGLVDYESHIPTHQTAQLTDRDVLHIIADIDSVYFPAGTRFQYSNTGYCLLALIVEKVAGLSYPEAVKELIFKPSDIKHATVYPTPHDKKRAYGYHPTSVGFRLADQSITSATKGDGGVYISMEEYLKWVNNQNPLWDESYKAHLEKYAVYVKDDVYYSLGWFFTRKGRDLFLFHSGESTGFHNIVVWNMTDNNVLALFSNRDDMKIAEVYDKLMKHQQLTFNLINIPLFLWLNKVYMNDL